MSIKLLKKRGLVFHSKIAELSLSPKEGEGLYSDSALQSEIANWLKSQLHLGGKSGDLTDTPSADQIPRCIIS